VVAALLALGLSLFAEIGVAHPGEAETAPSATTAPCADEQLGGWALDPMGEGAIVRTAPEFIAKAIPLMLGLMATARGLAELLLAIGARFQSADASRVARALAAGVDLAAKALALFGLGAPKQLVMERAEAIAIKEAAGAKPVASPPARPS
jgi:hypothetical protein